MKIAVSTDGVALTLIAAVFIVPQVVVSLPGLPEFLRTTDLLGAACLGLWLLRRARRPRARAVDEGAVALFLLVAIALSAAAYIRTDQLTRVAGQERGLLSQAMGLMRLVFLYAPALLACTVTAPARTVARLCVVAFAIAGVMTLVVCAAYFMGYRGFDALQTLADGRGRYFARLGGLPGEAGAFSYNALTTWQLLVFALAWSGRLRWAAVAAAALPLLLIPVYLGSQARIGLMHAAVFMATLFLGPAIFGARGRIAGLLGTVAAVTLIGTGTVRLPFSDLLLMRLEALVTGAGGTGELSSGRIANWASVVDLWAAAPLIGYGVRSAFEVLDHAVENFFLFGLFEHGIIGFAVFLVAARGLAGPVFRRTPGLEAPTLALRATLLASFMQWQVNDVNTYFQTYPALLAVLALYAPHARAAAAARASRACPRPAGAAAA